MGGIFDLSEKKKKIEKLTEMQDNPTFWQDISKASEVSKELSTLKKDIDLYNDLERGIKENKELLEMNDAELLPLITDEISKIQKAVDELEISTILSKEYDNNNCYLEIHPGAGGTESCDWASMLADMYIKFCEKENFKYEIIESQKGEEAGIKSITLKIMGAYAYGYLKNENGVHRLVRISPFDGGARRHTSFASVSLMPEIKSEIKIDISDDDLKIDVYHSSGAGGQSVNTSNSAVRITHLPTKIVVTCQNERSQLKNKEEALKILKNKIYLHEKKLEEEKLNKIKGISSSIDFGSQIRSYILEPYKMVKDHRTSFTSNEPDKILGGNIKEMLEFNLRNLQ